MRNTVFLPSESNIDHTEVKGTNQEYSLAAEQQLY